MKGGETYEKVKKTSETSTSGFVCRKWLYYWMLPGKWRSQIVLSAIIIFKEVINMKILKKKRKKTAILFSENGASNSCCPQNGGAQGCCPGRT